MNTSENLSLSSNVGLGGLDVVDGNVDVGGVSNMDGSGMSDVSNDTSPTNRKGSDVYNLAQQMQREREV